MSDFNIETVAIDSLRPHPRNYRAHPQVQIEHLEASLREYGWARNVVVASDGVILAGHGIVEAARRRGETTVPVHRLALKSTDPKAEKFMVLENEVSRLADDDDAQLAALLKGLADEGELLGTGYDGGDVEALLAELQAEEFAQQHVEDPGAEEPPEEPVTKTGDVWLCGRHRVVCGDCTEEHVWEAVLRDERAALCLTDPPYGVGWAYESYEDTPESLRQLVGDLMPIAMERACVVLLTPGNKNQRLYPDPDWELAWFCPAGVGRGPWGFCCWQPILAYGKDPYLQNQLGGRPDALVLQEGASNDEHPCAKPINVWKWAMERGSAHAGDGVVDPFIGSGTTLIAAEQLGRVCYGIEIEPRYVDVSVRRWCKATGRAATLESTGEPFPVGD